MAFALLLALFCLDAEGGGGTQQQAAQADRLAGFLAPAVVAAGQALQRFVDLVEQLLLPLQQAKLPLPLFLAGSQVGLVAGAFEIAQLAEFAFDARLKFLALTQQQVAEEVLLGFVHVGSVGLGKQFLFGHGLNLGNLKRYTITINTTIDGPPIAFRLP